MNEIRTLFQRVVAEDEIRIPMPDARVARNFRQKLYRYKYRLRDEGIDPLALILDYLSFEIEDERIIVVSYFNPLGETYDNAGTSAEEARASK